MQAIELKELKSLMPIGAAKRLSEITGIPNVEISRMMNGYVTKRTPIVINAVRQYVTEQREALDKLNAALNK